jgi:hypothetical protein
MRARGFTLINVSKQSDLGPAHCGHIDRQVTLLARGSAHFKPRRSLEKNPLCIAAADKVLNCISSKRL